MRRSVRATLGRQTDDVWGLVLLVIAILVTLAFIGLAGPVGEGMESGSRLLFGVWRFALPAALAGIGIAMIAGKPKEGAKRLVVGAVVTFVGSLALFHLMTGAVALAPNIDMVKERGGAVGSLISFPLRRILGTWGAFVVLAATMGMGVLLMTRTSVRDLAIGIVDIGRVTKKFVRSAFIGGAVTGAAHAPDRVVQPVQSNRGRHERPKPSRPRAEKPKDAPKPAATPPPWRRPST
jgi:hypothetical protein